VITPEITKALKGKKRVPVPEPEVRARPRGGIQWSCPDCGNLHSQDKHFWRRAMIQCKRAGCEHKFRVGVGFSDVYGTFTCLELPKWQFNMANRLRSNGCAGEIGIGRLFGLLDWECPDCGKVSTTDVDFFHPTVSCCNPWWIQLLIYKPSGSRNITPYDWSMPFVRKTHESVHPEEIGQV
jgi:hypothetical protein